MTQQRFGKHNLPAGEEKLPERLGSGDTQEEDRENVEEDNGGETEEEMISSVSTGVLKTIRILSGVLCLLLMAGLLITGTRLYCKLHKQRSQYTIEDEKAYLKTKTKEAVRYYEDKYGETPKVKESSLVRIRSMEDDRSMDVLVEMEDGTRVIVRQRDKDCVDDKQAGVIGDQIREVVLQKIFTDVKKKSGFEPKEIVTLSADGNVYGDGTEAQGSYYHHFYGGDMEAFLQEEKIRLSKTEIYVICQEKEAWQAWLEDFKSELEETFRDYADSEIEVCFLSEECYQKFQKKEYRKPDISMAECYGTCLLGRKEELTKQQYVKAADGVYITAVEPDLLLQEEDILFEKAEPGEKELNEWLKGQNTYVLPRTPVYQMILSDRIIQYLQKDNGRELKLYVRFVPEEAGITAPLKQEIKEETIRFESLSQSLKAVLETYIQAGKNASEEQKKELWQTGRLYCVEKDEDSCRCYDIYADLSDAELLTISGRETKEGQLRRYYFGGYKIQEK